MWRHFSTYGSRFLSVLIDFANFGLFHSIDFAISTRTPVHAILTSLQTSYRLLARRGSQVVSIEQGAIFPEHLAGHTWPAQAHHPEWKDATSSVGRSREYFAGSLSAARCFEAAGRGSTICNVDNLPLVAQQSVLLGGLPALFYRKRPARSLSNFPG